ncbi:MAG: DNA polymerase III subunit beta [Xanthomonadales bacterium]|jgi:DNA polymerase-3 subunit beta|nr:DNA polymerase III subunit beta [Xanthomonadales bacterium]MDH3923908.1 DNA polymerase III subunit beta [Xanthomonadales bacterium]MDH4001472.1 DNA polymerase III subunit beta [Xanthomonadales bacterium]
MKFSIQQEALLQPISQVVGVVERRQTLPVLANFLVSAQGNRLSITGTDMEVELIAAVNADIQSEGEITVPARKLVDIVRKLPEGVNITAVLEGDKLLISSGRGRYTLATLPATEFPATDQVETLENVKIQEVELKKLLDKTSFSMANQDVRYYLNGLLFEFHDGSLTTVATDGHRLAVCDMDSKIGVAQDRQMIVPRKGVLELSRMLSDSDDLVELALGKNHIRLVKGNMIFTSKLIDGRFPDYQAVIPKGTDRHITLDRQSFMLALQRASILSNEKYKGVRLEASVDSVKIVAHNPQHEEAVEELEAELNFDHVAIGFNVTYLLDALNAIEGNSVVMALKDANSSCLISSEAGGKDKHVVMPLKL